MRLTVENSPLKAINVKKLAKCHHTQLGFITSRETTPVQVTGVDIGSLRAYTYRPFVFQGDVTHLYSS